MACAALVWCALLAAGCGTGVEGGAVELSWRLRPAPGPIGNNPCDPFVCCDPMQTGANAIERIQLDWVVDGVGSSASWRCDDGNGVTGFELPPGEALLTVSPVCVGHAADPATYTAPAAEQRTVKIGDTVSLGAVELLLRVSSCSAAQPCICASQP